MAQSNKNISKMPADEQIIYRRRSADGKWQTIHKIEIIKGFRRSKHWIRYNNKIGSGTKTQILRRLLALIKD
jgi:hypothetical protein